MPEAPERDEAPTPYPRILARLEAELHRLRADRDRLDWVEANPVATKWDHRRGHMAMRMQFTGCGPTLRDAIDDLRRQCEC